MAQETRRVDIAEMTEAPAWVRLLEEVRTTQSAAILQADGEDVAVLTPARPVRKRIPKGRPTSKDDPLWDIVGIGRSGGPGDVSENVDKYLAEAYMARLKS